MPPPSALPLYHPSSRVLATDDPVIIATKAMIADSGRSDILSLAQGVVHWSPPPSALAAAAAALASDPASVCGYGPAVGLPSLVAALQAKVQRVNGLGNHDVMVTAGANQGFVNLVLATLDAGDRAAVFAPYYFNAVMALQMTGSADRIAVGPCDPVTWAPDLDWLERELAGADPPRMVVIVSPSNPTGCVVPPASLARAAEACGRAGAWLVLDSTYEDFLFHDDGSAPPPPPCGRRRPLTPKAKAEAGAEGRCQFGGAGTRRAVSQSGRASHWMRNRQLELPTQGKRTGRGRRGGQHVVR